MESSLFCAVIYLVNYKGELVHCGYCIVNSKNGVYTNDFHM